jgi:hypothetical protein
MGEQFARGRRERRSDFVTHSPEALSAHLQELALEEKHKECGTVHSSKACDTTGGQNVRSKGASFCNVCCA